MTERNVCSGFISVFKKNVTLHQKHEHNTSAHFLSADLHSVHTCRSADALVGLLVVAATGKRLDDLSDATGHSGGARSDDSPGHHVEL